MNGRETIKATSKESRKSVGC